MGVCAVRLWDTVEIWWTNCEFYSLWRLLKKYTWHIVMRNMIMSRQWDLQRHMLNAYYSSKDTHIETCSPPVLNPPVCTELYGRKTICSCNYIKWGKTRTWLVTFSRLHAVLDTWHINFPTPERRHLLPGNSPCTCFASMSWGRGWSWGSRKNPRPPLCLLWNSSFGLPGQTWRPAWKSTSGRPSPPFWDPGTTGARLQARRSLHPCVFYSIYTDVVAPGVWRAYAGAQCARTHGGPCQDNQRVLTGSICVARNCRLFQEDVCCSYYYFLIFHYYNLHSLMSKQGFQFP